MLSLENIVRNPVKTRSALVRRGEDPPIDQILQLDSQRKRLIQAADTDRALRNTVSKTIAVIISFGEILSTSRKRATVNPTHMLRPREAAVENHKIRTAGIISKRVDKYNPLMKRNEAARELQISIDPPKVR